MVNESMPVGRVARKRRYALAAEMKGAYRVPALGLLLLAIAMAHVAPVLAQVAGETHDYAIASQPLGTALNQLALTANRQIMVPPELVRGRTAPALAGHYSLDAALRQLLAGSGLTYEITSVGTVVVKQAPSEPPRRQVKPAPTTSQKVDPKPDPTNLQSITVTGTRIRGGTTPSPVITIGSEQMQEEGFSDLGEVIRSIPQNFGGGQNPGITAGATAGGIGNQNITGGSGLNLRGLGQDATLTLLNGRRMSYGGYLQMVDISAIPIDAVERIEIVPDGASAIYGSDAVGGVGNVILKRDFEGITVGTRYGGATDRGLTTHEYSATAGTTWTTGGLIATWKKSANTPIYADQRSYTQGMYGPTTLYQRGDLHSGLFSIHQSLNDWAEIHLDALRTERKILTDTAYPTSYYRSTPDTTTSFISPSVDFFLLNDWTLTVSGVWGKDESDYAQQVVTRTTREATASYSGEYHNKSRSYEVGAEGPLFALPAGQVRLAVGAGYRYNSFLFYNISSHRTDADGDERSRSAYAELSVPLIGSDQALYGVDSLALTAAIRAENYDSFGAVTTPKFGIVYSPSSDFTFKTSWGRSFKAPTLLQRYQSRNAYLYPATTLGGRGYAAGATVLYLSGGNPGLDPERARTWSASLAFHPETVPDLDTELTWFDIVYSDRVLQPVVASQALSNSIFSEFVDYSPTASEQAETLAASRLFYNYAGASYDASKVVAIINNRYVNTSQQKIKGLDLSGSYHLDLDASQLTFRGSVSWLDSTQATTSVQEPYNLAGTLFYPAKISGRIGAVWNKSCYSASIFGNYKSGVTDTTNRRAGASFTTFDATLRYDTGARKGVLSDVSFELSIQNMFNRAAPLYAVNSLTDAPYDSTNYSAIGRYLSFYASKHW